MSQQSMTPAQRVDRIFDEATGSDLSSWEKHQFLKSIRTQQTLSKRQEEILVGIERRFFRSEA